MENIDYGNYLYQLRKDNHLTQRYVAYELNVTDKAVSKKGIIFSAYNGVVAQKLGK